MRQNYKFAAMLHSAYAIVTKVKFVINKKSPLVEAGI